MAGSGELTCRNTRAYLDELLVKAQDLYQEMDDYRVPWRHNPARLGWLKKEARRVQSQYESMLDFLKTG